MSENIETTARPAAVLPFPGASTVRGQTLLRDAAAAYMTAVPTRDRSRAQRIAWWAEKLGDVPLADLDSDVIGDLLESYSQEPVRKFHRKGDDGAIYREFRTRSDATVNRLRSSLGGLLTWCKSRRLTPKGWHHPVRDTEARKESSGRLRFLDEQEEEALLTQAKVSSLPRLYLLCLMAIHSGGRLGEMLNLRGRDIEFSRDENGIEYGVANLPRTKNGDPATLVLTPEVCAEIRRVSPKIKHEGHEGDLLFPGRRGDDKDARPMEPKKAFERAVQDAHLTPKETGKEKVVFHVLRHTHASRLAKKKASLLQIADSMRHKSLSMVRRYAHLAADAKIELTRQVFSRAIADEQWPPPRA
jgi:integrase